MKIIILAAGYATRLYPLTINTPKALLRYKNKYILDYILDNINFLEFSEIVLITNNKFYNNFLEYKEKRKENILIYNNGSTSNENRLGAGNDLINVLKKLNINDECLVMACDNILEFSLQLFIDYYNVHKISSIMFYKELDRSKLLKTAVITINEKNIVSSFVEKPNVFISNNAVPPFYILNKEIIKYLKNIEEKNYDSPGMLIKDLTKEFPFIAFKMPKKRIDIG